MKIFTKSSLGRAVVATASSVGALALVIGLPTTAHALTLNNNNGLIAFANTSAVGTNATQGFTYRYANAVTIGGQAIDAMFSIPSITSGATIQKVDVDSSSTPSGATNEMINSNLNFAGATDSVTYQLDFVKAGTTTPVTIQNVAISVGDIDIEQFAQFSNITSHKLSSAPATVLTPQTNSTVSSIPAGAYRFQSPTGTSTATDQDHWVEVRYDSVSSLTIVLGAITSGGAYFSIDFQPSTWSSTPTTVTPTPTPYTISYNGNGSTGGSNPNSTTGTGTQSVSGNTKKLAKPGYHFVGWNTAADGSGVSYAAADSIVPSSDMTLYAVWATGAEAASASAAPELANTGTNGDMTPLAVGAGLIGLGIIAMVAVRPIVRRR